MWTPVLELSQRVSALLQVNPGCQSPSGAGLPKTCVPQTPVPSAMPVPEETAQRQAMALVQEPSASVLLGEAEAFGVSGGNKRLGVHQDLQFVPQFVVSSMEHRVLVLCLLIDTIIPPGPERLRAIQE